MCSTEYHYITQPTMETIIEPTMETIIETIIEPIEFIKVQNDVNKNKFNSNNHWLDGIKPMDYDEIINNCDTSKWIDKFHNTYNVINIFKQDVQWMKKASEIGIITKTFSKSFEEDKNDLISKYSDIKYLFSNNKYFVRTDSVSLKYGMHGVGPYTSFNDIIESLCTCAKNHTPLCAETSTIKIYLMKWININHMNEFRVFVYKNKITAISQQYIYCKNNTYEINKNLISVHIDIICKYYDNVIKKKIDHMDSYTYDFAILEDNKPYLIEFNSFGKEYASGSALFHWIIDEQKLYNENNKIYFRYTY